MVLGSDFRSAVRSIRANPAFAATVVLLIALGIGITTANFALVDGVILRKLPVPYADRLVNINATAGQDDMPIPRSIFERLQDRFEPAAKMFGWSGTVVEVHVAAIRGRQTFFTSPVRISTF